MTELAINGGRKSCDVQWPSWPVWDDNERKNLLEVLESGQWWYGRKVREFEERFAEYHDARYGVTAMNGAAALEAALLAMGVGAGDEVIVPPYTFVATATAVLRVNAIPVFADIEPVALCIDPDDVERKVNSRTKAIIPVHMGGHIADMDRLWKIADRHGLFIVEDACHAWGSQWKGKGAGALGHCGVFSFQVSKNVTSGEGGIVLTDDADIAERCRSYTNCGRRNGRAWYEHFVPGGNMRMTEFQAAILLAQLSRLDEQLRKREENTSILAEALWDLPGIRVVGIPGDERMTRRSHHLFSFRVDSGRLGVSRSDLLRALVAEGLIVTQCYPFPLYANPLFDYSRQGPESCPVSCPYHEGDRVDYSTTHCPVCEQVCKDTCWIPQHCLLADTETILAAGDAIRKVCENTEEIVGCDKYVHQPAK